MSVNPMLVNQLLDMGLPFGVDEIQEALTTTGNTSAEAALNYLLTRKTQGTNSNLSQQGRNPVIEPPINELRDRVRALHMKDVSEDMLNDALRKRHNDVDRALKYITEERSKKGNITSEKDVFDLKKKLMMDAEKKRDEKRMEDRQRQQLLDNEMRLYEQKEKEKEQKAMRMRELFKANRAKLNESKKKKEVQRKRKLLQWHEKQDKYAQKDILIAEETNRKRNKLKSQIENPDQAIKILIDRYGINFGTQSLNLIKKILENIISHPKEQKYRRLNLSNRKIHNLIETPVGALRFLEFVGFEVLTEKDPTTLKEERYLCLCNRNLRINDVKNALKMVDSYLTAEPTCVPPMIQEIKMKSRNNKGPGMSPEQLYCAIITLHEMLRNVCISPTSEHLLYANIDDAIFKQRIGQFPPMVQIMRKLGYKLNKKHRTLKFQFDPNIRVPLTSPTHPQIRFLQSAMNDLAKEAKVVLPETPIARAIASVRKSDPSQVEPFLDLLLRAVERVLEEPLDMKYQRISHDKLKSKFPKTIGITGMLKALGFKKSKDENVFVLDVTDLDLLRWRKDMLARSRSVRF